MRSSSQITHESDSESTTETITNGSQHDGADIFLNIFEDEIDYPERHNCVIHQLQIVVKESKVGCAALERCVEHFASFIAKGSHSYLIKSNLEWKNRFLGKKTSFLTEKNSFSVPITK
jgi:hypothetical protein